MTSSRTAAPYMLMLSTARLWNCLMNTSLSLIDICRCMMEDGYYPVYRKTYITFSIGDDTAVLEYDQGILSIKVFFSIDDEYSEIFLTAANTIMQSSPTIKSLMDEDGKNITFSCETFCDTKRGFRKFLPWMISRMKEALILAYTICTTATEYVQ